MEKKKNNENTYRYASIIEQVFAKIKDVRVCTGKRETENTDTLRSTLTGEQEK